MAKNQKSTLKHLLSGLATFTGKRKKRRKRRVRGGTQGRTGELAYSFNGLFYRRSRFSLVPCVCVCILVLFLDVMSLI